MLTMNYPNEKIQDVQSTDVIEVRRLYRQMLENWNKRDADLIGALFTEDGNTIGFDGSPINGRAEIVDEMSHVFASHQTAAYVGKIREVRFLNPQVAVLRAVAGMIPPGGSDLNPDVNAVQSLIAVKQNNKWLIALYQNTPAQFHGRPEMVKQLTEELRQLLKKPATS
jgi:uncharacterized protein (TIGR02246 family)